MRPDFDGAEQAHWGGEDAVPRVDEAVVVWGGLEWRGVAWRVVVRWCCCCTLVLVLVLVSTPLTA